MRASITGNTDGDTDQQDHDLGEIADLAACIQARLSIMRHAGKRGSRDFAGLRNQLQDFVNKAMAFARATEQ